MFEGRPLLVTKAVSRSQSPRVESPTFATMALLWKVSNAPSVNKQSVSASL